MSIDLQNLWKTVEHPGQRREVRTAGKHIDWVLLPAIKKNLDLINRCIDGEITVEIRFSKPKKRTVKKAAGKGVETAKE